MFSPRSLPRTEYIPRVECKHNKEEVENSKEGHHRKSPRPHHHHPQQQLSSSSSNSSDLDQQAVTAASPEAVAAEKDKLSMAGSLSWKETDHHQ